MNHTEATEYFPFEGGPPHRFQTWLGLIRAGHPRVVRRAVLAIVVGWAPLVVLTALRGDFIRADAANSFALDFGAHARFLLAAPLLIFAESICLPRLAAIARQFTTAGLVADSDRGRYDHAVVSTQALMKSRVAELLTVILAYGLVAAIFMAQPPGQLPAWHGSIIGGIPIASPAGWWGLLISLPILLMQLLGWLWRIWLWTRFLWLMGRLELKLIPSHPDHAGGLKFVASSLDGFLPLGLIIGVIAAGPVLNQVVHRGAPPLQFKFFIGAVVAFVVALLTGPLLVFARRLIGERHRGVFEYGALALKVGEQLEQKWLTPAQPADKASLAVPDFSATTDLYSIVSNVYAMLIVPLEIKSVVLLAGATLLPFLPLVLMVAPFDVIVRKIAGLLL
jgi:hypothetical protein